MRVEIGVRKRGFVVEGEVTHAFQHDPLKPSRRRSGMGVRFLPVEMLLAEVVPEMGAALAEDSGPDEDGVYRVVYPDREQFLEVYERDIRTGGLYIVTRRPAAVEEKATIDLVVARGIKPLRLEGKVVDCVEPGEEDQPNLMSGMGIEIIDFPVVLKKIERLAARLRV